MPTASTLTARQVEVLSAVLSLDNRKVVAHELGVTPRILRRHLAEIQRRLGVRTPEQAIAEAVRQGLL